MKSKGSQKTFLTSTTLRSKGWHIFRTPIMIRTYRHRMNHATIKIFPFPHSHTLFHSYTYFICPLMFPLTYPSKPSLMVPQLKHYLTQRIHVNFWKVSFNIKKDWIRSRSRQQSPAHFFPCILLSFLTRATTSYLPFFFTYLLNVNRGQREAESETWLDFRIKVLQNLKDVFMYFHTNLCVVEARIVTQRRYETCVGQAKLLQVPV